MAINRSSDLKGVIVLKEFSLRLHKVNQYRIGNHLPCLKGPGRDQLSYSAVADCCRRFLNPKPLPQSCFESWGCHLNKLGRGPLGCAILPSGHLVRK